MPKPVAILFALAVAAGIPPKGSAANPSSDAPRSVTCSFSNPGYSGWCKQDAPIPKDGSADRVCQDILKCLNDVQCIETYCSATSLRGGWKLEKVEEKK